MRAGYSGRLTPAVRFLLGVGLLGVIVMHLKNPFIRPVQATLLGLVLLHGVLGIRSILLDFGLPARWHRLLLLLALLVGLAAFALYLRWRWY